MYAAKINYHEKRHSIPQLFFAISCMIKAFVYVDVSDETVNL